jgi:hypothetical protein
LLTPGKRSLAAISGWSLAPTNVISTTDVGDRAGDGAKEVSDRRPFWGWVRDTTAFVGVRNNWYPFARALNFTSESVWPRFGSKESGRFPKLVAMRACSAGLAGCVLRREFNGEIFSARLAAGAVTCDFARGATHTAATIASKEMPAIFVQRLLLPKRSIACFNNMFFLR